MIETVTRWNVYLHGALVFSLRNSCVQGRRNRSGVEFGCGSFGFYRVFSYLYCFHGLSTFLVSKELIHALKSEDKGN